MVTASTKQNISSSSAAAGTIGGRSLFRIVSFACLAGFALDIISIAFPLKLGDLGWRVGFLQQVGDRSIILLLGCVFLMLGSLDMRKLRQQLAMACLGLGLIFMLSSVLAIRDGVALQKQTSTNIANQATQLQSRIEGVKDNPAADKSKITPQAIDQALQQVTQRAEAVQKKCPRRRFSKTGSNERGVICSCRFGLDWRGPLRDAVESWLVV
ncbi:MAG: hypothetical protein HC805_06815 [Alkalinema sp. RL_2_19]|nr:hypothetical protein [Alkalinema sp. RL_2_19]